ncbi:hypothetical protein KAR91_80555 [Candidatus Pacearchaeota archaeon]|nr:hypothetical protein [Candidatus Pacearchaeota archaeon]
MIEQPETESEQLRRVVRETHKNILIIKERVQDIYGSTGGQDEPSEEMEDNLQMKIGW